MTDLKNIYDYLEKINFEKRIKEEVKFIRDRRNSHDFEIIVSPFVITQFVFSIVRDFYEEIYKDIEKQNAQLKERNDSLNNRDINLCRIANGIRDENFALKELLKQAETQIIAYKNNDTLPERAFYEKEVEELLGKIDEVLKC